MCMFLRGLLFWQFCTFQLLVFEKSTFSGLFQQKFKGAIITLLLFFTRNSVFLVIVLPNWKKKREKKTI